MGKRHGSFDVAVGDESFADLCGGEELSPALCGHVEEDAEQLLFGLLNAVVGVVRLEDPDVVEVEPIGEEPALREVGGLCVDALVGERVREGRGDVLDLEGEPSADAMTPRELSTMKSVITTADVNERAAYGYTKERRVRLASFCASGNKREFLSDITGNRRWLPFEVASIASPFTHTFFPYGRMYAQARYLIEHDYPYWFEQDEIAEMADHQDEFRAQDNEEQLLPVLFDIPAEGRGEFLTTAQISQKLIDFGSIKRPMSLQRLGMILQKQGFSAKRVGASRGWLVYQRSMEEMKINKIRYAKDENQPADQPTFF